MTNDGSEPVYGSAETASRTETVCGERADGAGSGTGSASADGTEPVQGFELVDVGGMVDRWASEIMACGPPPLTWDEIRPWLARLLADLRDGLVAGPFRPRARHACDRPGRARPGDERGLSGDTRSRFACWPDGQTGGPAHGGPGRGEPGRASPARSPGRRRSAWDHVGGGRLSRDGRVRDPRSPADRAGTSLRPTDRRPTVDQRHQRSRAGRVSSPPARWPGVLGGDDGVDDEGGGGR